MCATYTFEPEKRVIHSQRSWEKAFHGTRCTPRMTTVTLHPDWRIPPLGQVPSVHPQDKAASDEACREGGCMEKQRTLTEGASVEVKEDTGVS